ncbi:MAG: sulfotransferase [Caulobacteraceae bacterium]|nr:sulfotransferase [Caulobacteraceae bacterium]
MGRSMTGSDFAARFDALHEQAAAAAGFDDFGPTDYYRGLRVLLDALDEGPRLGLVAEASAMGTIVSALVGRLWSQAGWNAHPEFAAQPIERPLIIIGLPRTGTTALHQLLSLDPQFQGLERWLTGTPMPRPPRAAWATHPVYQAAVQRIEAFRAVAPHVAAAHWAEADDVDECLVDMAQSFVCNWFPSNLDVPAYDAWFRAQDETGSFLRHRQVLQLVGLGDERRWLLKNPSHVFGAEALLNAFPDACVVQTHRHPAQALSSLMSLLGDIRDLQVGAPIDRERVMARELSFWAQAADRGMAAQARHPERFVNVRHDQIRRDPLAVVQAIYQHFGLELSPEAERRMRRWSRQNKPKPAGRVSVATARDGGVVAEAFSAYIDRYDLAGERVG